MASQALVERASPNGTPGPWTDRHFSSFNRIMTRCASCNGIVARQDVVCYSCGDPIPESVRPWRPKRISKVGNVAFLASLGLTAFCFLSPGKLSLWPSLGLSTFLLIVRIVADRGANKDSNSHLS
jgi:DNA-directed RNA polymerase subunit N (RpoN/RPB10)